MKKINHFMFFQWLVFLPLILPLSILSGAAQGIRNALIVLFEQLQADTFSSTIIHEDNQDSYL
jgi:hypothetical protein